MSENLTFLDGLDMNATMSAHMLVLRTLLKANPAIARSLRDYAMDFETLSRGVDERSARIIQQDILQMTQWLDG